MNFEEVYNLPVLVDERGSLIALDKISGLPFDIKRVYYIFNTKPEVSRGFHAHKNLHQMAICITGSCSMVLDDGFSKNTLEMNSCSIGVYLPPMIWHEMHNFSDDCILLVLASDYYYEDDYIRDYTEFKKAAKIR